MPLPKQFPRTASGKNRKKDEARILANRYRVENKLGSGNFGTAYLVTDLKCKDDKDKLKVLKEIPVGDLQPDETVDAMHESSLLRNLDHPGIVKFHDSFIDGEFFCIVTEFCEGGDVDQKIQEYKKKGKKIPEAQVVEWIIQLLLSVQYMHDRKILHRDLKTRNIFLKNNVIKVGDFGISRILMGTTDMASTFVGTPYYMSPEVLKHEGYNSKSDVWSVACVLYELCTLKHAFEGQSLMGVMYKIVEGDIPEWPKGFSKDLKGVFEAILIKQPEKRPSASEVLKLPFVSKQMEILKNTMMDKHNAKEQKDTVNRESQQIYKALHEQKRLQQLREESEAQILKNMSPRERMRLRKQQQADEEGRRMKAAALQQLVDNKIKYNEIRHSQNPYEAQRLDREEDRREREEMTDAVFGGRPKTAPGPDHYIIEESDDDEEDSDEPDAGSEEEEMQTVIERSPAAQGGAIAGAEAKPAKSAKKKPVFENPHKKPLSQTLDPSAMGERNRLAPNFGTISGDDRPITPMRNQMIYDQGDSTLDFKDGVPVDPKIAETYYFEDDEFEGGAVGSDEDDELEGTVKAAIGEGAEEEEVEDLINIMQNALDKSETLKSVTLTDASRTDAFGPSVRDTKIKNLYAEAQRKLGKEQLERAYTYLKEARFGARVKGSNSQDENEIMKGLSKIVKNPNDCFLVDQLLFLEAQAQMAEM